MARSSTVPTNEIIDDNVPVAKDNRRGRHEPDDEEEVPELDERVREALSLALRPAIVALPRSAVGNEPELAPLAPPPEGMKPDPHYGTARPADPNGPVPRVVNQLERAPVGLARYKVHCRNFLPQPVRYILSRPDDEGEIEARRHYLQITGIDIQLQNVAVHLPQGEKLETPRLVVTRLPD